MGQKGDKMTSASDISAENIKDRLADLGDIRVKKMFGGYGIFEQDKMFGLIDSQGVVYFKIDESNLAKFEEAASAKHAQMPYYSVPEDVLNNDTLLEEWAGISIMISKG